MVDTERYVVVYDKDLDFCRLFRADSDECPPDLPLWTGMGLRRGYDAMMRLNRERRPIPSYHVCTRIGPRGEPAYRVLKTVTDGWTAIVTTADYASARLRMKDLVAARAKVRSDRIEEDHAVMLRTGMAVRKNPKFTAADRRYIAWLKESGRFERDAA